MRRDSIISEQRAAAEFPQTWGFLCGPKLEPQMTGFRNVIAKYHGGAGGAWTLHHKRVHDDSALGHAAREMEMKLKPKMGQLLSGTTHKTNIIPGLRDSHGRTLTTTNEGYDCIPNRSAAMALRSHTAHTIGDTVRVRGFHPIEKYHFPVTATHEIGWRPKTLEIFGVAEFGLKKGIAAEYGLK